MRTSGLATLTPVALLAFAACATTRTDATSRCDPVPNSSTVRTSTPAAVQTATVTTSTSGKVRTMARLVFPLFSERFGSTPIAQVEDEVIPLRALVDALAAAHESHDASSASSSRDFSPIIRRLVNTRLLMLEARATELDSAPELVRELRNFREMILRDRLKKEIVKDLVIDEKRAQRIYEDLVREHKVRSLLFRDEMGAKQLLKRLEKGAKFDALADELIAHKEASGAKEGDYLDSRQALPQIQSALKDAKVGAVLGPLKVPQGWAVLHVEGMHYPEDAEKRAEARKGAWEGQARETLESFLDGLVKKLAKSYEKRIAKLDLDAKEPGLEKLMSSTEVLIEIQGDKPITTGDLATAVAETLFHAPDPGQKGAKLTKKKFTVLRGLITRRMLDMEARRRGYHLSEEYQSAVKDKEDSLLVSLFIQRTIAPTVTITEGDAREYYNTNIARYSFPEMFSLDGIWYPDRATGEAALAKLKAGADFRWLQTHATDQLPKEKGELELNGSLVSATSFEPKLQQALAGADTGEYRLYVGTSGMSCVVQVLGHVPARPQPYADVRESIAKEVFGRKLGDAIDAWAKKLEKGYKVQIFFRGLED